MNILILQSVLLMLGAFGVSALFGWLLAGRAQSHHSAFEKPASSADWSQPTFEPQVETAPVDAVAAEPVKEPVPDATKTADTFTSGVVVPFVAPEPRHEPEPKSAYAPTGTAPKLEMAAANVAIMREDSSLQRRVSSLAAMTPESVEAAVQQAGSGLEPVRLGVPQGPPDDLTVISGINSFSQNELNTLGIFYYWQVAGWSPENVAWIASRIPYPRRIARENWMAQAARLAKLS